MGRRFWLWHGWLPGALFLAFAAAGAFTNIDVSVARMWAFDAPAGQFIGAGVGDWWAKDLIHSGGGTAIRLAGLLLLASWLASMTTRSLSPWRRPAGYAVTAVAVGAILIGLIKATSNVDCPRVLEGLGGTRPYVHLIGDRPDALPRAHCFPGGHSSSGFAIFALYFALRERNRTLALQCLAGALAVGTVFAVGQQARGAHFLSHDVWSAAILWFSSLAIYTGVYDGRLWPTRAA